MDDATTFSVDVAVATSPVPVCTIVTVIVKVPAAA